MANRAKAARTLSAFTIAAVMTLASVISGAVEPSEVLPDPALEARARDISKELRCLVCQNQSIDDSDAELASDLRRLVRERLHAGDTDAQVIDYVVSRYGDFVLLKPPFKPATYALWLGPAAIAVVGAAALIVFYRRRSIRSAAPSSPLGEAEQRRLAELLKDERT